MKEIFIKETSTVMKVAAIYVAFMSAMVTGALGLEMPELGLGVLVIAGLLLIMIEILNKGGADHDGGRDGK